MTDQHLCEHPDCGRPAPYGYICYQCVDDTRDWLNHITHGHAQELLLIARRQLSPATRNRITNKTSAPQDAINLAVWSLWHDITHRWPNILNTLHRQDNAVHTCQQIRDGVTTAIRLTEGEPEQAVDDTHLQNRMKEIFPMRPKDLIPWFRHHLGIRVTQRRISDWKRANKIEPNFSTSEGWNFYHPADILRAIDNDNRHDPQKYSDLPTREENLI